MKVLITGASGLIGTELVKSYLTKRVGVNFLTTNKSKINQIQGAKGFYWNPSNNFIDLNCFDDVDSIIHLSGATISKLWTSSYKKKIFSSRVDSTKLLYNSIKKLMNSHKVKNIVSASAIGIYPSDDNEVQTETTATSQESFMQNVVLSWERELTAFESLKIKVAKLRLGLVLTKKGGVLGPLKIAAKFGLSSAFGTGKQGQSWIHIQDTVRMFIEAVEKKWEGNFNAVSPNPVTQTKFISALAKAIKRPFLLPPIPKFFIKLIIGEMSHLILDSHWVSSEKVNNKGFKFDYPEVNKALESLLN